MRFFRSEAALGGKLLEPAGPSARRHRRRRPGWNAAGYGRLVGGPELLEENSPRYSVHGKVVDNDEETAGVSRIAREPYSPGERAVLQVERRLLGGG